MARPRKTALDNFFDDFALMPADERAVTMSQLEAADRAAGAHERRQKEIEARAAKPPVPPAPPAPPVDSNDEQVAAVLRERETRAGESKVVDILGSLKKSLEVNGVSKDRDDDTPAE